MDSTTVEAARGQFQKGKPKTGGRTKGTPNKVTADVRDGLLEAWKNKGGVKWFEKQFDENPVAVMTLLGKIIPSKVELPEGSSGKLVVRWET